MSNGASTIQQRIAASKERSRTVTGLVALESMQSGCDAKLSIVNPVGQQLITECQYIGFDNEQRMLFTMPAIYPSQRDHFFLNGVRVAVSMVSTRGEGARVRFVSRIMHVIVSPLPIFVLAMPDKMELCQLRKESRYELMLPGNIVYGKRRLEITLKDLSHNGCSFSFDELYPVFDKDTRLDVLISQPESDKRYLLSGLVRNQRRVRNTQFYGLLFNAVGIQASKSLLSNLMFDGTRMAFPSENTCHQ